MSQLTHQLPWDLALCMRGLFCSFHYSILSSVLLNLVFIKLLPKVGKQDEKEIHEMGEHICKSSTEKVSVHTTYKELLILNNKNKSIKNEQRS